MNETRTRETVGAMAGMQSVLFTALGIQGDEYAWKI